MEHTISHYLLALWEMQESACLDINSFIAQTKRKGVFTYAMLMLMIPFFSQSISSCYFYIFFFILMIHFSDINIINTKLQPFPGSASSW